MKITKADTSEKIEFHKLNRGDVFRTHDEYYLKTIELEYDNYDYESDETFWEVYNCVNLHRGNHCYIHKDAMVELVDCELVIK